MIEFKYIKIGKLFVMRKAPDALPTVRDVNVSICGGECVMPCGRAV